MDYESAMGGAGAMRRWAAVIIALAFGVAATVAVWIVWIGFASLLPYGGRGSYMYVALWYWPLQAIASVGLGTMIGCVVHHVLTPQGDGGVRRTAGTALCEAMAPGRDANDPRRFVGMAVVFLLVALIIGGFVIVSSGVVRMLIRQC